MTHRTSILCMVAGALLFAFGLGQIALGLTESQPIAAFIVGVIFLAFGAAWFAAGNYFRRRAKG